MQLNILKVISMLIIAFGISGCSWISTPEPTYAPPRAQNVAGGNTYDAYHTSLWQSNPYEVWNKLTKTPKTQLAEERDKATDKDISAWINLVFIAKQKNLTTQQLADHLIAWRQQNPEHPGNQLFPANATLDKIESTSTPKHIAILLPQTGLYGASGQLVREGFLNAYYSNSDNADKPNIKFYDTGRNTNIQSLYEQAVADGADFVVGPLLKPQVQQLSTLTSAQVPILALNYIDRSVPNNMYQFGLLPEDEAIQLAERAQLSGKSKALLIAPKNAWGNRLVAAFKYRWEQLGGSIQDNLFYTSTTNFNQDIATLLRINPETDTASNGDNATATQRRQDFDVVILFSQASVARVVVPLLRYYYVNSIPIFTTSSSYAGSPNPLKDLDLNGVIVCDIPWKRQNIEDDKVNTRDRLYAVGQDAYRLSQSLQRLTVLNNFPLYGTTGALTLAADHKIHRRLPCKSVRNGLL